MKLGSEVIVYDRYRLAVPAKAIIEKFSDSNDGVRVQLLPSKDGGPESRRLKHDEFWVHKSQLEEVNPEEKTNQGIKIVQISQANFGNEGSVMALDENGFLWDLEDGKWIAYDRPGESDSNVKLRNEKLKGE